MGGEEKKYYHGGPAGLRGFILPSSQTGARSCADLPIRGSDICSKDKCYVTPDVAAATLFASSHKHPMVYEVRPENLSVDPDCSLIGLSFECDKAAIVRAIKPKTKHVIRCRKVLLTPAHAVIEGG